MNQIKGALQNRKLTKRHHTKCLGLHNTQPQTSTI